MNGICVEWWVAAGAALFAVAAFVFLVAFAAKLRSTNATLVATNARVRELKKTNDALRKEFAKLTGWTEAGRLPENPAELIREEVEKTVRAEIARDSSRLQMAIGVLEAGGAPRIGEIGGSSQDMVEQTHWHLVELLRYVDSHPDQLEMMLHRSEFAHLFRMALRLEAYAPDATASIPYGLAMQVVRAELADEGVLLDVPRPLTLVRADDVRVVEGDLENLRAVHTITGAVNAVARALSSGMGGERLVVDCVRPGWRTADETVRPQVRVYDRSWLPL